MSTQTQSQLECLEMAGGRPPSKKTLAPFGMRLRSAIERSTAFPSRAAFARHHGLEGATLYRYETGDRQPPLDLVREFAQSLGVSVSDLAGDPEVQTVDLDATRSPYPEVEDFIADELAGGRAISDEHLAELRGLRLHRKSAASPYGLAADLLRMLRAQERGKAPRLRPVR